MGYVRPSDIGARARQAEGDGWTGMKVFDTQCLFGDVFVMMTAAAMSTDRLRLSISASNPATRHPAVAASAIAAVADIAPDRAWCGIGRGDSVLADAGRLADRVSLGLGADPARIRWAIETARAARREAGLDPSTLSFASVIAIGVADDMGRARQSVANMVASSARFSVMSGHVV